MPWPRTSLSITPASRRAASSEYCGSSPTNSAAVWIESRSSSTVVAPSNRPLIVLVATLNGSTSSRSRAQRSTARTILFTSTSSRSPLRLRTCIWCRRIGAAPRGGVSSTCTVAVVESTDTEDTGSLLVSADHKVHASARDSEHNLPITADVSLSPSHEGRGPPARDARGEVAGLRTRGHDHCRDRLPAIASQTPSGAQCFVDGFRSHSPLRGSPGLAPGSLLRRPPWLTGRTNLGTDDI